MNIGLDMRLLQPSASGGIIQNQVGVFRELFASFLDHRYIVFCTAVNRQLFESPGAQIVELPVEAEIGALDAALVQHPVDILFRSYPDTEILAFPAARQIVYIPDNQHDFLPELFSPNTLAWRRSAFHTALAGAGAIGTISEFSRQALASRAPPGRDIFLMSPALQREHSAFPFGNLDPAEQTLLPRTPFFYYPGNFWPHKNHRRVIAAFRDFMAGALSPHTLVLTGHAEGWQDFRAECGDLDIRHLGYVSAGLVARLLRQAVALIFFSQFEGFGIPLLEAFHARTPVLCSNVTSLPEVAGDAALMVDPTDIAAMADAMRRIAYDAALRRDLAARGRNRLALYSWRQSAENFIRACGRVAERAASATSYPPEKSGHSPEWV